ncbi:hypothetical protein F4820DRAFT_13300 [Hypoxylon rubiginosum]|uniref:Uncharacterized protein n=1 Tax=Hypoxylon rubiginosum TaxID=110542 RepID=A0ACB9ZD71_9PEZI|nr:hypothetical protein F4820DRAFT_13300 [Hypoxylon rubiginosum]
MDSLCEFEGNSDMYGLGVRIGCYLQWSTSIFAENLYGPAVESCRDANTTFQFAMLAGLVLSTGNPKENAVALEGYIALLFCFASVWIASLQVLPAPKSDHADPLPWLNTKRAMRGAGDMLLNAAICSYGIYLLYVGFDQLQRTTCPETVFFFGSVELFGWFRIFLKVVLIISLIGSAATLLLRILSLFQQLYQFINQWRQSYMPQSPNPPERVRIVKISLTKLLGSIVGLGIFIVAIELTIAWNHIRNVYECASFSQLFPLVAGATNLARVIYQLTRSAVAGKTRIAWSY